MLEIVTRRLSAAEVTIRGSKELLSHESCLTTQPLPVGYTNRQVSIFVQMSVGDLNGSLNISKQKSKT